MSDHCGDSSGVGGSGGDDDGDDGDDDGDDDDDVHSTALHRKCTVEKGGILT